MTVSQCNVDGIHRQIWNGVVYLFAEQSLLTTWKRKIYIYTVFNTYGPIQKQSVIIAEWTAWQCWWYRSRSGWMGDMCMYSIMYCDMYEELTFQLSRINIIDVLLWKCQLYVLSMYYMYDMYGRGKGGGGLFDWQVYIDIWGKEK